MNGWISVTEQLPPDKQEVILQMQNIHANVYIWVGYYLVGVGKWYSEGIEVEEKGFTVIAWRTILDNVPISDTVPNNFGDSLIGMNT